MTPDDYPHMACDHWREMYSAVLDGEADTEEVAAWHTHLRGCTSCRAYAAVAERQRRELRLTDAAIVPDLRGEILDQVRAARIDRGLHRVALRAALGALAALMLLLAVPQLLLLVHAGSHAAHQLRHLAGWDLAFALALGIVAVQPWRARGLLPMATAVATIMITAAIVDLVGGNQPGMPGTQHALQLVGVLLLWRLARIERLGWEPHGIGRRRSGPPASDGAASRLRVVDSPGLAAGELGDERTGTAEAG